MGLGITGAVYAHLIAFTVSAIIGMHFLKKVFPDFGKIKAPTIKKKLIEFSWPLSVVGFLWMVVKWTDIVMLGYFNVAQDVGIYNIALPTAELLMVIIIALRYIVMPVLSELYSLGNKKEFKQTYHAVNKWAFSVSLPIFLLMAFFPATILGLLFGNAYIAASLPLTILAIGYFVYTVGNISNTSVLVVGKTKLNMATVILVALSNFVLNLILIPMFGIIGAAIATSTSFFVFFFASIGFCYKELHIHPFKMAYLKAIVAGFISIGVFYLIAQILFTTVSWWVLIIFFPFSIALYSLLFLVMKGLDKNDLLMLSILEKKGVGFKFLKKMIKKFAG